MTQEDMDLQTASYAQRLVAWPIADIERVLADYPRRNRFWPSWAELEAELPELAPERPRLTRTPPEHLPAPSRAQEDAELRQPFTRQQWGNFCAAMASLRDQNVPHMARDSLLRIGESIEARQRPHAERMGWA